MAKEKAQAGDSLDKIRAALEKKFGKDSAVRTGSARTAGNVSEVIPTGIEVIDRYLAQIGGLPVGRITELSGQETSGKTTLGYAAVAAAQQDGAAVFVLDAEHAFDETRASSTFGVDIDNLLVGQPAHMAQALEMLKTTMLLHDVKKQPLLIVWDSLASTPTAAELKGQAGEVRMMETPRLLSEQLKVIAPLLQSRRTALLIINQLRDKPGVMFGPKSDTPGGRALKFHASLRLQIFGGKAIKNPKTEEHTGKIVTVVATKTRFSAPFRKARIRLNYASGWDNPWSTTEHAKTMGVLDKARKAPAAWEEARIRLGWAPGQAGGSMAVQSTIGKDEEE